LGLCRLNGDSRENTCMSSGICLLYAYKLMAAALHSGTERFLSISLWVSLSNPRLRIIIAAAASPPVSMLCSMTIWTLPSRLASTRAKPATRHKRAMMSRRARAKLLSLLLSQAQEALLMPSRDDLQDDGRDTWLAQRDNRVPTRLQ